MNATMTVLVGGAGLLGCGLPTFSRRAALRRQRREVADRLAELAARDASAAEISESRRLPRRELPAGVPHWLRVTLARADVMPRASSMILWLAVTLAVAVVAWRQAGWAAGLMALGVLAALPAVALRVIARRRVGVLSEGLPFYFDAIRQMLMAGSSLQQALVKVSDNADPGMQRYLLPMVRRVQNGASATDSLLWLAAWLELPELHMFALAVQANIRYGGRLSTVLISLSQSLRDRTRVLRELRSATAETRVGSMVVGSLPAATGVLMSILNPRYYPFFRDTEAGHELFLIAAGLQLIAVLAIRRLMRLDF